MDRRSFAIRLGLGGVAASGALAAGVTSALAVPDGIEQQQAVQFLAGQPVPKLDVLLENESRLTGNQPAYREEVAQAVSLLLDAPTNTTPFLVSTYFLRLNEGEFGPAQSIYAREWPVRANPLIVAFFDATQDRTPVGDVTPWCAAHVSWCIERSREGSARKFGTKPPHTVASRDFRTWGTKTDKPLLGDIAVFRDNDDDSRGHVGFFLGQTGDHVYVLGGNQRSLKNLTNGEVTISTYPKAGRNKTLHSFRTDSSLHPE